MSISLTMTTFLTRETGAPRWAVKLIVPQTRLNLECYGETPSEALNGLAEALGPKEYSILRRWAVDDG